jgi:hypothetical protein
MNPPPLRYGGQAAKNAERILHKDTKPQRERIAAKRRKKHKNKPQMNQPSREAMAGKLRMYADLGWP